MLVYAYYDAEHVREYDAQGVEKIELLGGTNDEVRAFKYTMKAGSSVEFGRIEDHCVFYVFGNVRGGKGLLKDKIREYPLDQVCFYAPDYEDEEKYTIAAVTDFEFIEVVAHMDAHDLKCAEDTQVELPFFRTEAQCDRYAQNCKTPGTISRTVLYGEFDRLGRLTCGICETPDKGASREKYAWANPEVSYWKNCVCDEWNGYAGTIEKGHPEVHQWNYALGGAKYRMNVGEGEGVEMFERAEGDWDYIPAGPDHSLYADPDKDEKVHYCWVEFNTHKRKVEEYPYVCKADVEKEYVDGYSEIDLKLEKDFKEIQHYDIKFYRCNLKAGCTVAPKLEDDSIVILVCNGKPAKIVYGEESFEVKEPSFFIPEFERQTYTVTAGKDDVEFIKIVSKMNAWDKIQYSKWHKHLPFFRGYTDCVPYGQKSCKLAGTRSWTVLQGTQLGHVTIGVVKANGAGTKEKGHPQVHQWNYCLGESDFMLDVEGRIAAQKPGDFSFINAGDDHSLLAKPGKEVFYVWIEYYSEDDLSIYSTASVTNRSPKEAYDEYQALKK